MGAVQEDLLPREVLITQQMARGDSVCDLCLTEKTCIVLGHRAPLDLYILPQGCVLLNVRDEVLGHCPHKLKHKLIGRKTPEKRSS